MEIRLRRVGNSLGVILPKGILDRYALQEGDDLELVAEEGKLTLHATDVNFQRQIATARIVMEKYKIALKKLAE